MQGHTAAVTTLTCTNLYVVSAGLDDRLCIYERMKGHQLHWIQMVRILFTFNFCYKCYRPPLLVEGWDVSLFWQIFGCPVKVIIVFFIRIELVDHPDILLNRSLELIFLLGLFH